MKTTAVETFAAHIESVHKLMNFDRDVLSMAIAALEELRERLKKHHNLDNPHLTAERTLQLLQGYRQHDSLRPRYETIFNQALVLLVSYFGSAVHDLFRTGVSQAIQHEADSPLMREQFRMSFRDLREAEFNLRDIAPDLLVQAKDISFQDMQSISRAFKDYLGINIERGSHVNDIILAQGCRHVIVHTGGFVDDKLIRQVSGANPRVLKPTLALGEQVQFSVDEVSKAAASMLAYIRQIEAALTAD